MCEGVCDKVQLQQHGGRPRQRVQLQRINIQGIFAANRKVVIKEFSLKENH